MDLKKTYNKDGYTLTFLKKIGDWYVYEKVGNKEDWMVNEPIPHWEIVKPMKQWPGPSQRAKGITETYYSYPKDSMWGDRGFTITKLDKLHDKIFELTGVDISNDNKMIFPDWYDWEVDKEVNELNKNK